MLMRVRRVKRRGSTRSAVPSQLLPTVRTCRVGLSLASAVWVGTAARTNATASTRNRMRGLIPQNPIISSQLHDHAADLVVAGGSDHERHRAGRGLLGVTDA